MLIKSGLKPRKIFQRTIDMLKFDKNFSKVVKNCDGVLCLISSQIFKKNIAISVKFETILLPF